MAKALITSALPYINDIKHLGNLAGSLLPADIHARYRRQIGDEVLFICAQTSMVRRPNWQLLTPEATWQPIAGGNTSAKQTSIAASVFHSTISGGPRRHRTTNSPGIFSGASTSAG